MPPDVRKASGLPAGPLAMLGYAQGWGVAPTIHSRVDGSAERFRTSGGKAAIHLASLLNIPNSASPGYSRELFLSASLPDR